MLNRATVQGGAVPVDHIALGVPARPRPAPDLAAWVAEAVDLYRDMAKRCRADQRRLH